MHLLLESSSTAPPIPLVEKPVKTLVSQKGEGVPIENSVPSPGIPAKAMTAKDIMSKYLRAGARGYQSYDELLEDIRQLYRVAPGELKELESAAKATEGLLPLIEKIEIDLGILRPQPVHALDLVYQTSIKVK